MYTTSNRLCAPVAKRYRLQGRYLYRTAALLKVAERLRAVRPVFATAEEAIERVLAL